MAGPSIVSSLPRRLEGKVALITGAASGIGKCTAKLFASHGAKVIIADVQDGPGRAVADSIGPSLSTFVHCDVTNEDHIERAVDQAVSAHGRLDVMFNNAGIVDPFRPHIADNEKADFERVIGVNVTGVFLGMKHAARAMVPGRAGSIISTASVCSGIGGAASHGYTASKHAVVGLTKSLAVELGQYGIRVNCLSPYLVVTPLSTGFMGLDDEELERSMNVRANLKGVTLRADDVAYAALYLASDEAKYVSGQNLFVDGGFGIMNSAMNAFGRTES